MSDDSKRIYNACDPFAPATAAYYHDCSEARGSSALTPQFQRHLAQTKEGTYLRFLLSGHIGCGKSSELAQLKDALDSPSQPSDTRYFPVLLNVSDYLDDYDADITDILLAIVTELAATLRDKLGIELKDSYFTNRFNQIKEFFLSDVEISKGELPLLGAKVEIQRLKQDTTNRQKVREALRPHMTTMLTEINTVFDATRLELQKVKVKTGEPPYKDFVLLLDNLEKLERIEGPKASLDFQRDLFLGHAQKLRALQAHVLYTVPLPLVFSEDGAQLRQHYGSEPVVLPMIKVMMRGTRAPYGPGLACLRQLLEKRFHPLTLEEVFESEALDFLLTYSGGHVRDLMFFIKEACTYGTFPLSLRVAHQAIGPTVRSYSTSIPEPHWEKLAKLDRSSDQKIPVGDNDYLVMLKNLSVLEYINGGGEDTFDLAAPWYAVNPIVREMRKFKDTVNRLTQVSVP